MSKKVVKYFPNKYEFICEGMSATVVVNHHPSVYDRIPDDEGFYWVQTSKVIRFDNKTKEFETMNTIYQVEISNV